MLEPGPSRQTVGIVVIGLALKHLALVVHGAKTAVLVHGHARVKKHVAVVDQVSAAVLVKKPHVRAQLVRVAHRAHHVVHHAGLFGRQLVGVLRVKGGEVAGAHLVLHAVDGHGPALDVHVLQQQAVVHLPVGVALDDLALELKENDRDGFLHKVHAVFLVIGLLGKDGELTKRDAVRALEDL